MGCCHPDGLPKSSNEYTSFGPSISVSGCSVCPEIATAMILVIEGFSTPSSSIFRPCCDEYNGVYKLEHSSFASCNHRSLPSTSGSPFLQGGCFTISGTYQYQTVTSLTGSPPIRHLKIDSGKNGWTYERPDTVCTSESTWTYSPINSVHDGHCTVPLTLKLYPAVIG